MYYMCMQSKSDFFNIEENINLFSRHGKIIGEKHPRVWQQNIWRSATKRGARKFWDQFMTEMFEREGAWRTKLHL